MLNIKKKSSAQIEFYYNDVYLGDALMDVDGYYYFWFEEGKSGAWSDYGLKAIADKLQELNKDWNDKINKDFENEKI